MTERKLTSRQADVLQAAFLHGSVWIAPEFARLGNRSRAGGAIQRMIDSLRHGNDRIGPPMLTRELGITAEGMRVLRDHLRKRRKRPVVLIGHINAALPDMERVEADERERIAAEKAERQQTAALRAAKAEDKRIDDALAICSDFDLPQPHGWDRERIVDFIERIAAL